MTRQKGYLNISDDSQLQLIKIISLYDKRIENTQVYRMYENYVLALIYEIKVFKNANGSIYSKIIYKGEGGSASLSESNKYYLPFEPTLKDIANKLNIYNLDNYIMKITNM